MTNDEREAIYLRQRGIGRFTPAQYRRLRKRLRRNLSGRVSRPNRQRTDRTPLPRQDPFAHTYNLRVGPQFIHPRHLRERAS